ncbi:hypothetical protein C6P46_001060 [Rhodotorula mucilaginosa]|uniref:Carboxymuconolactone decarboxylase-like domain-containing protein n=1 Tax=Rhodotorula mucilaginosa TaxID=5537 RepID=A0A9P6VVP5_RHOMI|nr:hypothetical protein C6P46_001060 [Rhodotorula mucilaginosa]
MSVLPVAGVRLFLRRLAQKDLGFAPSPSATLLPLLTAATLGKGCEWLQPCVEVGFELLPPNSASSAPRPALLAGDEPRSPRRFLVAQVKEAITKSAILIGVPRSIELAVKLGDFLDEEDLGKPFVRQTLEEEGASVADLGQNGLAGLRTVYKENLDDIFANFSKLGLEDIRFMSQYITYGTFLTPSGSDRGGHLDPLASDPRLLSIVTLSTLVPQRTEREILWHLRGAIRRGWTRAEVERLQSSIEKVAAACGVEDIGKGMPRVSDVEPQPEEKNR